jgi:6-phosphogluconate dehydrogenase (decarboxylating)
MKTTTQLGMVGLGRMGSNMVRRLIKGGVQCVVFNRSPQKVKDLVKEKAVGASSLAELVQKLQKPRAVWLMVPAAVVDKFIVELLPLLEPGDIAEVWRRGSVIASWLLDLTADALAKDSNLSQFEGRVSDSVEGRWTIKAAIDVGVPVPVLTTALYARFASRGAADFQGKVLSAMRYGFGGHLEKSAK